LPFDRIERLTSRQLDRYYRIYEWQAVEEQIRDEYLHPAPPAKPKPLPKPDRMAELIRERIAKNRR
jgi:hypothetical protein